MSRNISRRDLLTKVVPVSAAFVVAPTTLKAAIRVAFYHGVASGDPTQSAVIIWTRVTTSKKSIEVSWDVSSDKEFNSIVASGIIETSAAKDYTVKVDVETLNAGTQYFYRFNSGDAESPVGQTQTLPVGAVASFKMGVCSCANFPGGHFNAYATMAKDKDIDVVVHLGDYLYEYDALGYASAGAEAMGRVSEPLNEVSSLSDSRRRHAQYKADPNLQKLHSQVPFILSWDDHELANDAWKDGADNHDEGEGDWSQRKANALQAYYEWMPIRAPKGRGLEKQWRNFEIGDLATLIMLETRLSARDEQVELSRDMRYFQINFDISDVDNPVEVETSDGSEQFESFNLPYDVSAKEPVAIKNYARVKELSSLDKLPKGIVYYPNIKEFTDEVLDDPERQILGEEQRQYLSQTLETSVSNNKPWQFIGNQTLIAKVDTPNLAENLTKAEKSKLPYWLKPILFWSRFGVPFGTDSWNGYGAEREWLIAEAEKKNSNMVVLTGDTHAAWGIDLESQGESDWRGVELGTTSISSPGLPESLGIKSTKLDNLLLQTNDNLQYSETGHRGYLTLDITSDQVKAEFHKISTVKSKKYKYVGKDTYIVKRRSEGKGIELNKA